MSIKLLHPEGVPQHKRLCDPVGVDSFVGAFYQGFTEYSSPLAILLCPVGAKNTVPKPFHNN